MSKLVSVQLETSHHNTDGSAWYAYTDSNECHTFTDADFDLLEDWVANDEHGLAGDNSGLSIEILESEVEEVPSRLSKKLGCKRYFVGMAV